MEINKKKLGLITKDEEFFAMPNECRKYYIFGDTV